MDVREELFKLQDLKYRDFHKKLIPEVEESAFIGVRVPALRSLAREIYNNGNAEFDDYYYEEKMLKGFLIGLKKCSISEHIDDLKHFVCLIDNWAVCDCCCSSFKFVKHNKNDYYDFILSYIGTGEFETRFSVVMLMDYYLDDEHIDEVIDILVSIKSEYHYVNMAIAWALSFAFIKYENKITSLLKKRVLSRDVQNKTIQKICDSCRVDCDTKRNIKMLKISK